MGKAKGKHRLDKYYHLAKEQGYRSRASFKLLQLDAKFAFLSSARSVLDLCAAPGSWLQVAVARVPVGSFILGVDLVPIRALRGALSIAQDITTPACRAAIRRLMAQHGCPAFDVVLHDGSPNVGGRWASEATGQAALVLDSVKLATEFLSPKGTFVTKIFRSQDYSAILYCLKQLFEKVEVTKPTASRSTSAEIYVVGSKYKAPAKIDPRLLDVKHLFQGAIEPPKVTDVLRGTKQKRNRDGYEDGMSTVRKVCLASDFVWSEAPLDILGSVTSISFDDPACSSIREHALTTEEIKYLCDDLRVLGKQDFKLLLKWRMNVRKALTPIQKAEPRLNDMEKGTTEIDEDDRLLKEMEELSHVMTRKKKRAKKLLAKRRAKDKIRKATGVQIDVMEDGYQEQDLFSLASITKKKDLQAVGSVDISDDDHLSDSESDELCETFEEEDSPNYVDTDEERQRYDEQLEDFLDEAYDRFIMRNEGSTKQRKRAKSSHANDKKQLLEDNDEDAQIHSTPDSDEDAMDDEANPLMVPLHIEEKPTQEQLTEKWFSQDIFIDATEEGAIAKNDCGDEGEEMLEEKGVIPEKSKEGSTYKDLNILENGNSQSGDFEIVPAEATDTSDDLSSSSSEESELDDLDKAKILAYAKKMLRKKQREQILDDSYNRYMFDDEGLPKWFAEEEKQHCQRIEPVTKEEIAAMRAQFREIDARPAKKVAEAKARKKRAGMRKLEKVRRKANVISDQTDISDRSKRKMIDELYKKAVPKKPQKEYVVAKKGVQVKPKGKVLVDRRMKKDVRSRGMGKSGKGGSKKGKSVRGKPGKDASKGKDFRKGNKGKKMKVDE